jgi:UPF0716 protein FxsA
MAQSIHPTSLRGAESDVKQEVFRMLWILLLLLTIVPLVELYLLVRLTQATSFLVTVLVILGTGAVGAIFAKIEGLRVLRRIQEDMARGKLPADGMLDGALILAAAILLITPGLLTDALGLLLLAPPTRAVCRSIIKQWIRRKVEQGTMVVYSNMGFGPIADEPWPDEQQTGACGEIGEAADD